MFIYSRILALIEKEVLKFAKYKVKTVLILLIIPFFSFLEKYFRGEFVKLVSYYGVSVPYLLFIVVALITSVYFINSLISTFYTLLKDIPLLVYASPYEAILSRMFKYFLSDFTYFLVIFLPLTFLFNMSITMYILLCVLSFLNFIPGLAFSLAISYIVLPRRSEGETIVNLIDNVLYSIIPVNFAAYVLPKPEVLTIVLPHLGIVEEVRKIILLRTCNVTVILGLAMVSFSYLILAIILFNKRFEEAKRKGWVSIV